MLINWEKSIFAACVVVVAIVAIHTFIATTTNNNLTMAKLFGVDFEVFGKVQGVFFRKYTQQQGQALGLKGWCMNTKQGSVVGRLEGERDKVDEMKQWLQKTGSPKSSIEKAEFRNEKEIDKPTCNGFDIIR